ncbi:N-methyl-L-tryptophan oxidase [Streptomyces chartreusis]|uniref:N-methyl-L-tryptophan oxidase n=1 Tax=Streptomyces chartreusis TaxID=1969 RepID=UPI0036567345
MTAFDADVAVIGLGAWGSSALWRLAARGVDAIGFDSQSVPNPYGSSHGHTRLFRVACHEHQGLTPVAHKARDLWYELGDLACQDLLHQSGVLSVGPETGRAIETTRKAATLANIPVTELTVTEVRERFPQHTRLGDHYMGLFDPEAGFVRVEEAISAAAHQARQLGARVYERTAVTGISESPTGVHVTTTDTRFLVGQVVLAAGPWMSLMQDIVPLTVYRAPMLWWQARDGQQDAFQLEHFPAFIRHYDDESTLWGHGATATTPVKLGLSHDERSRLATHPDQLGRGVHPYQDYGAVVDVISWAVPGLETTPVEAAPCMVTMSPDGQFVIGRAPGQSKTILAGGCSGHGFKHATAIGEIVAQIVCDEDVFTDIDFMSPIRFAA